MLRLSLVIAVVIGVCSCQLAPLPKLSPILCRDSAPVDAFKIDEDAPSNELLADAAVKSFLASDDATISIANPAQLSATAQRIAKPAISPVDVSQARAAKAALKPASGNIIARPTRAVCPALTSSYSPQELCPSRREILRTFYSGGFCYVLFPYWQRKYYTRCLCRECRVDCKSRTRRNLCVPERYTYTNVWAICRSGWSWRVKNARVRLAQGKCDCKSYRRRCLG